MPRAFNDLRRGHPKGAAAAMIPGTGTQTAANIGTTLAGPPNLGYGLYSRRNPPSVLGRRRRRKRRAAATTKKRRRRSSAPRRRKSKRARLVKGSAAAKRFMARLRAKRRR